MPYFYRAAIEITYPFFSTPMNAASFRSNILEQIERIIEDKNCNDTRICDPTLPWNFRNIVGQEVYQVRKCNK